VERLAGGSSCFAAPAAARRLADRVGPRHRLGEFRTTLADDAPTVAASFRVELGLLPADYDPAWSRDRS
jgi:hypothetical protein